jgi:N-methylhydantoinase B
MLLTLVFPASANASALVFVRLPGAPAAALVNAVNGRRRAGQETIRCTGGYAHAARGEPYLMREVLGGGPGCRSGRPPFPGRGPRCRRLSGSLGAAEAGRL